MKVLPVRHGFSRAVLALLALCIGAGGCQRFERQEEKVLKPPDYLKISGMGNASMAKVAAATTLVFTGNLSGPIAAEGGGDAGSTDRRIRRNGP